MKEKKKRVNAPGTAERRRVFSFGSIENADTERSAEPWRVNSSSSRRRRRRRRRRKLIQLRYAVMLIGLLTNAEVAAIYQFQFPIDDNRELNVIEYPPFAYLIYLDEVSVRT